MNRCVSRGFPAREEPQESSRVPVETPPQRAPDRAIVRPSAHSDDEDEEEEEGGVLPDPEKDDMMARRTRAFHKPTAAGKKVLVNRFLPVPGSAVHKNVAPPLSGSNQLQSRLKIAEKKNRDRYFVIGHVCFVCACNRTYGIACTHGNMD